MKLIDIIKVEPRHSGVLVPCGVSPEHTSKKYVKITLARTTILQLGGSAEKPMELIVCQSCYNQFTYDLMKQAQELQNG